MTGTRWRWLRPVAGAAALTVVVWQLGVGPFLDGVRAVDGAALAAGAAIGALTTVCCAWRWTIVARGLGLHLPFPAAVAAYYRSVFLNLTLPGGVVGDVHRGVSHGRRARDIGLALRAVAWERTAGQFVQAALTAAVLVTLPSPARSSIPLVVAALVATVIAVVLVGRARPRRLIGKCGAVGDGRDRAWGRDHASCVPEVRARRERGLRRCVSAAIRRCHGFRSVSDQSSGGRSRWARLRDAIAGDVRHALLARRAWPAIVLTSALVVIGHAVAFVIAARTAGATAPLSLLLPLALLAMLAMVLPSVAGWGPREGAAAWAFAAAGLGAGQGVATAVTYGIMALVASLPGALVVVTAWVSRFAVAQPKEAADA